MSDFLWGMVAGVLLSALVVLGLLLWSARREAHPPDEEKGER